MNKEYKKEDKMIRKKSSFRYEWGDLDLISTGFFFIGLLLTQNSNICFTNLNCSTLGFILMAIGVLKQISRK